MRAFTERVRLMVAPHVSYIIAAALAMLAAGTTINFILIGGALGTLSSQAEDGKRARATQCRVFPISTRVYEAAHRYGLISAKDLETYKSAAPTGCP